MFFTSSSPLPAHLRLIRIYWNRSHYASFRRSHCNVATENKQKKVPIFATVRSPIQNVAYFMNHPSFSHSSTVGGSGAAATFIFIFTLSSPNKVFRNKRNDDSITKVCSSGTQIHANTHRTFCALRCESMRHIEIFIFFFLSISPICANRIM